MDLATLLAQQSGVVSRRQVLASDLQPHDIRRLGWGQVYGRPCETALRIGLLLRQRGWCGEASRCPQCPVCVVPRIEVTG